MEWPPPADKYNSELLERMRRHVPDRRVAFQERNGAGHTTTVPSPCIVIVCPGRKRGFLCGDAYIYDSHHYLVLSVPLPFESETEATAYVPMLAVSVPIDLHVATELALTVEAEHRVAAASCRHR